MSDTDIVAELRALAKRKRHLKKILQLRQEVGALEMQAMPPGEGMEFLKLIMEETCREFQITAAELMFKSREERYHVPRQVIFYLSRQLLGMPYHQTGAAFGKDRGTVLHGAKRIKDRMETEASFRASVLRIKDRCAVRIEALNEIVYEKECENSIDMETQILQAQSR